ncbi:MAG TPA: hypothetical protein VJ508_04680, partial [Saprospiraceae bacterium]|nr:hypothetical protein [Saprospiraceae bacterium]
MLSFSKIVLPFSIFTAIVGSGITIQMPDSCRIRETSTTSIINTAHLDHLYDELRMGEDTVAYIHIYAASPDYHFVSDPDEGMACVDDASRAAIFYFLQYQRTGTSEYFRKGKMLIKFLAHMQADNGYFYNFIRPDGKINTQGSTSKPEPNWWSWRALWAYGVAIPLLQSKKDQLAELLKLQRKNLTNSMLREADFQKHQVDNIEG